MKYLIMLLMLVTVRVNAECCQQEVKSHCCNSPKVVYHTERQLKKQAELEKQVADLRAENELLKITIAKQERPVHIIEERVEIKRVIKNKSALSLIAGASKTKLKVEQTPTLYKASTEYEPDLGLMFQHDFGDIRGTIAATVEGSLLLGIGLAF